MTHTARLAATCGPRNSSGGRGTKKMDHFSCKSRWTTYLPDFRHTIPLHHAIYGCRIHEHTLHRHNPAALKKTITANTGKEHIDRYPPPRDTQPLFPTNDVKKKTVSLWYISLSATMKKHRPYTSYAGSTEHREPNSVCRALPSACVHVFLISRPLAA